jgi:hypothetical protein
MTIFAIFGYVFLVFVIFAEVFVSNLLPFFNTMIFWLMVSIYKFIYF